MPAIADIGVEAARRDVNVTAESLKGADGV